MAAVKPTSTIMIMVGITGDLAQRYLLPAITRLAAANRLPENFWLIGVSRRNVDLETVLKNQTDSAYLRDHLEMRQMDLESDDAYIELFHDLTELETQINHEDELHRDVQRLYYLSVPPEVSSPIIGHLGTARLATAGSTKVMMEKPFGSDLASAHALVDHLTEHFQEEQIYRIDHYVAKEMVQNIVTLRQSNVAVAALWRGKLVTQVEILAAEAIDIEGRATFYEQTGNLRDLVQSHLLQILAHVIMPIGDGTLSADELRSQRLAALRSLSLAPGEPLTAARRAQYEGYRVEVKNPDSITETFTELNLISSAEDWAGVPLRIVTGKALSERRAHVKLTFAGGEELTLRIQPDPAIDLAITTRQFGYDDVTIDRSLSFSYTGNDAHEVNAYERVMLDALRGDRHLFISSDEVIASWEVIDPVQRAWATSSDDMLTYPKGTRPDAVVRRDA